MTEPLPPAVLQAPTIPTPEPISLQSLPDRRHLRSINGTWLDGKTTLPFALSIGWDETGRVVEVFADGMKQGATLEALLDDACILLSFLLQSGWDVARIAEKLKRESEETVSPAPSIIGHIAQLAADFQVELDQELEIARGSL